jgi:hypothetical protein
VRQSAQLATGRGPVHLVRHPVAHTCHARERSREAAQKERIVLRELTHKVACGRHERLGRAASEAPVVLTRRSADLAQTAPARGGVGVKGQRNIAREHDGARANRLPLRQGLDCCIHILPVLSNTSVKRRWKRNEISSRSTHSVHEIGVVVVVKQAGRVVPGVQQTARRVAQEAVPAVGNVGVANCVGAH